MSRICLAEETDTAGFDLDLDLDNTDFADLSDVGFYDPEDRSASPVFFDNFG